MNNFQSSGPTCPTPPSGSSAWAALGRARDLRAAASTAVAKRRPATMWEEALYWILILGIVFVAYTFCYLGEDALPGTPESLEGWWGWYDQGGYIASARAFANGTWRSVVHLYPPLYPLLGSLFVPAWPAHPFFLVDFAGLALSVVALITIGRQQFGPITPVIAVLACFTLFPTLTIKQWDIPWTTSLSSGIGASLLLAFDRFSQRGWGVTRPADWLLLGLFSLGFGAMGAVRPLDAIVWLPAALVFFISLALRNAAPWRTDFRASRLLAAAVFVIVTGLVVPVLYVVFNEVTSGTIWGTYILNNRANGYEVHAFVRKFISLFFESSVIYVEKGQAVADQFWPLYLAFPLVIFYLLYGRTALRVLCLTVLTQFIVYVPYADLLPNGMFRYYNIHYFTWTFPWLLMLCLGFLLRSLSRIPWAGPRDPAFLSSKEQQTVVGEPTTVCLAKGAIGRRGQALAAGVMVASTFGVFAVGLRARPVGTAVAEANPDDALSIAFDTPQKMDFIDVIGASGSWSDIYFGANRLEIDGRAFKMVSEFRLVPTDHGLRIVLPRSIQGQHLTLTLDPGITITPGALAARAANVGLSFACRFTDCALTPLEGPLPLVSGPTTVEFDDENASAPFLLHGWYGAESLGRWSSEPHATIGFRVKNPHQLQIEAVVIPLLSTARLQQTVTLTANGCKVGEVTFALSESAGPKAISGIVPASCVPPDGRVDLDLATDGAPSPSDIGIGQDRRPIGAGLKTLTVE